MDKINLDQIIDYRTEYTAGVQKSKVTGDRLVGLCPFHNDSKPSFSVDLKTGKYNCFSCGASGNYINFYAHQSGLGTKDAYAEILRNHGIEDPAEAKKAAASYTVEQYAEEKHLPAEWLKEVFLLGVGREKDGTPWIKIPYLNEKSIEQVYRKRFHKSHPVRFKWRYGSAGKLIPYGVWRLPEFLEAKEPKILFVEGESDTQSLWYMDFPTIGVPGATTYPTAWTEKLNGANVSIYLHIEPDQGGKTFVSTMARKLKEGKFDGKVYTWNCSQFAGAKDPSDLLIRDGKELAAQEIRSALQRAEVLDISKLEESLPEAIPGAPKNLIQPAGWIYDNNGIHRIDEKTNSPECVCRTPIILTQRLRSIETGEEKIEVAFKRDDKWNTAIFPRSTIFQSRSITALTDLGCTITSENSKQVVRFLEALEKANFEALEVTDSTSSFGWQTQNRFLPGHGQNLVVDVDSSLQSWVAAYSQSGTLAGWIETMKRHRERYKFRFILASAFTAPLLRIIKQRIFFVYNWGDSRGGKTAALKAALSAWGNPDKLMVNFNATQVALERMAGFFCDLPLGIDERQLAGNRQESIEKIVYMLASGTGRARGSKSGGIQKLDTWRTVILATGEEPIARMNSQTGVDTRMVEIIGGPFENEADAGEMHQLAADNAGWAGPEFISYIMSIPEEELLNRYSAIFERLKNFTGGKGNSHTASVAAVTLADTLIEDLFFKDESKTREESRAESMRMAKSILQDIMDNKAPDVNESAAQYIADWIASNTNHFGNDAYTECYGTLEGNTAYVFVTTLREALEKAGFSYRKTIKWLADEGVIRTTQRNDGRGTSNSVTKFHAGRIHRFTAIDLSLLTVDDDADDPFPDDETSEFDVFL